MVAFPKTTGVSVDDTGAETPKFQRYPERGGVERAPGRRLLPEWFQDKLPQGRRAAGRDQEPLRWFERMFGVFMI